MLDTDNEKVKYNPMYESYEISTGKVIKSFNTMREAEDYLQKCRIEEKLDKLR